jgi:hypothetical protein
MPKDDLVEFVRETLERGTSDDSLVLLAFDGEELKSFLIACDVPRTDHVFIIQVWADKELTDGVVQKQMFFRLCMWTEGLGKSIIRGETVRNSDAFFRRWGFKKTSEVLTFEIPSGFEIDTIDRLVDANKHDVYKLDTSSEGESHGPDDDLVGDAEPEVPAGGVPSDGLEAEPDRPPTEPPRGDEPDSTGEIEGVPSKAIRSRALEIARSVTGDEEHKGSGTDGASPGAVSPETGISEDRGESSSGEG